MESVAKAVEALPITGRNHTGSVVLMVLMNRLVNFDTFDTRVK